MIGIEIGGSPAAGVVAGLGQAAQDRQQLEAGPGIIGPLVASSSTAPLECARRGPGQQQPVAVGRPRAGGKGRSARIRAASPAELVHQLTQPFSLFWAAVGPAGSGPMPTEPKKPESTTSRASTPPSIVGLQESWETSPNPARRSQRIRRLVGRRGAARIPA